MKKTHLTFLLLLLIGSLYAQKKEIAVKMYQSSSDFSTNKVQNINAIAIVKEQSDSHLWVQKLIDSSTRKKIKNSDYTWAIEHDGAVYFNLLFSEENSKPNVFVKLNIIGNYCAIYIRKNSPKRYNSKGFKLQALYNGIGIYKTTNNHTVWKNKNNQWVKILLIDMSKTKKFMLGYAKGSTAHFLTLKELENIVNTPIRGEKLSFEKVDTLLKSIHTESMQNFKE